MKFNSNHYLWKYFELAMTTLCVWSGAITIVITESHIGHDLGPHLYGDYKIAILTYFCIGQALVLGTDNVTMKLIPTMLEQQKTGQVKSLLRQIIFLITISSGLWWLAGESISYWLDSDHKQMISQPVFYYLSFASIWALAILGLRLVRALGHTITSMVLYYAYGPLMYISLVHISKISFRDAVLRSGLSYVFIATISYGVLWVTLRKVKIEPFRFSKQLVIDAGHYVIQQLFSFPSTIILLFVSKMVNMEGNQIGVLAIVFMLAGIIGAITMIIKNVFMRRISLAIYLGRLELKRLLQNIYIISLLFFILACFILYLFFPAIQHLLGGDFHEVDRLTPIVLIGVLPSILISGDIFFLNYHLYNKYLTPLLMLKSLLITIMGVIFIHHFAIDGAIFTYILLEIIFNSIIFALKQKAIQLMPLHK